MGYHQAGFTEIVGVDLAPQPRYPFTFVQGDALEFLATVKPGEFDLIHTSPPCQAHTSLKTMHNAKAHLDLVPATRAGLRRLGTPYVIENVPGAPLLNPVLLCGTMFGLGVEDADLRRHRLFETSFFTLAPECRHGQRDSIGVYGGHVRNRRRARTIGVYGEGCRDSRRKFDRGVADFSVEQGRASMGIDWMTIAELSQAIPPAYTRWIGRAFLEATP